MPKNKQKKWKEKRQQKSEMRKRKMPEGDIIIQHINNINYISIAFP
jgi:hypothetical protein